MIRATPLRFFILAALVSWLGWYLFASGTRVLTSPEDLRAFYCGGAAVLGHHDPYLAEPLRSCEVRETLAAGLSPFSQLAIPAPLPGYAFAPLAFLALIPFPAATSLYVLAFAAAFLATVAVLRRLVPFSPIAIVAALAFCDGLFPIIHGQIVPFVILAICGCALETKRGHFARAAVYATLASVEPHVALPMWISLAIASSRARAPLAIGAAILAVVAVAALGFGTNVEYVTHVLPAHARSEAAASNQYSLTTFLYRLGVARETALTWGNLPYAAMAAFGIAVARRLAQRLAAPELSVLVPPAFVLFGGPYIHYTQMAIAVPALLVLAARLPDRRAAFSIALIAIAVPWADLADDSLLGKACDVFVVAAPTAFFVWRLKKICSAIAVAIALTIGFGEFAIDRLVPVLRIDPGPAIARVADGHLLAEATWRAYMDTAQTLDARIYIAICLPTWIGLLITIVAASSATLPNRAGPATA